MKRLLTVLVIVFSLILYLDKMGYGDQYGRRGNLYILVKSDKSIYEFGEPIVLNLTVYNGTSEPLFVSRRIDPSLQVEWELFREGFGHVPLKAKTSKPLTPDDFAHLNPDEEIGEAYPNLWKILQNPLPLEEGLYGLRITYSNQEKIKGPETWTGTIITNRLSFRVKSKKRL
ncbi:MAG: hypothetical protein ACE5FZ_05475 [Nitrospiria bacterium]